MKNGYERQRRRDIIALDVISEIEDNIEYYENSTEAIDEFTEGILKGYQDVKHILNIMKERYQHEY